MRGRPPLITRGPLPPSPLQKQLQSERDFGQACRIAEQAFLSLAQSIEAESAEFPDVRVDVAFWVQSAERCYRARWLYVRIMALAQEALADRFAAEGLEEFSQALTTGDYRAIGL